MLIEEKLRAESQISVLFLFINFEFVVYHTTAKKYFQRH